MRIGRAHNRKPPCSRRVPVARNSHLPPHRPSRSKFSMNPASRDQGAAGLPQQLSSGGNEPRSGRSSSTWHALVRQQSAGALRCLARISVSSLSWRATAEASTKCTFDDSTTFWQAGSQPACPLINVFGRAPAKTLKTTGSCPSRRIGRQSLLRSPAHKSKTRCLTWPCAPAAS